MILIITSYISLNQIIKYSNLSSFFEKILKKKLNIFKPPNIKNQFIVVFFLRVFIPYSLVSYYLSFKKFKLLESTFASLLAIIPSIFLLSTSSKNLISGNDLNFNTKYLFLFILYTCAIIFLNFVYVKYIKKNEKF